MDPSFVSNTAAPSWFMMVRRWDLSFTIKGTSRRGRWIENNGADELTPMASARKRKLFVWPNILWQSEARDLQASSATRFVQEEGLFRPNLLVSRTSALRCLNGDCDPADSAHIAKHVWMEHHLRAPLLGIR